MNRGSNNGPMHIEFRSIHKTNVLKLSDEQIKEFKKLLDTLKKAE